MRNPHIMQGRAQEPSVLESPAQSLDTRDETPLVVDLDGTLLNSDLLAESFFSLLSTAPLQALAALGRLGRGRAAFKAHVAVLAAIDFSRLPWNAGVLDLIATARALGRPVFLASASDRRLVAAVAAHLDLFDGIFGSDGVTNLSGQAKSRALCAAFGAGGFDYAGNAGVDMAVWENSRRVIVVNAAQSLVRQVRARWAGATVIATGRPGPLTWLKAIRVHQWVKNLLLFVPILAAHRFDLRAFGDCGLAFFSFCFCASSVYVMNDLVDLHRDRAHPSKRRRPFAAGTIPIMNGLAMVPVLLSAAIGLALLVDRRFIGVLAVYYVVTILYSLVLKRQMMIDVVTLACLYGLRLLAGAAATDIALSAWLATFSIFLFTSLALVKRCTELAGVIAAGSGDPAGRGYRAADLSILETLASTSGLTAALVFELYVNSDSDVIALYSHPKWLSAICVVIVYWVGYVMLLTHRGEMKDDPVVFAATDRTSLCCGIVAVIILLLSM